MVKGNGGEEIFFQFEFGYNLTEFIFQRFPNQERSFEGRHFRHFLLGAS